MSGSNNGYGEIKANMSEFHKDFIKREQYKARKSFERPPYAGTIAEVNTDKTLYQGGDNFES